MRLEPVALALLIVASAPASAPSQVSGRFHLVRSVSGSRGAPEGQRFVMEDPRTQFQAGKDRQVLVLFEWQGPTGRHHCEGAWKDPSGHVVFTSTADVDARGPRFAAYWGLSLPDAVTAGTWVVEATVDGESAGAHAFQIVAGAVDSSAPLARRALAMPELYQRGLGATLTVEAVDGAGVGLGRASGLFVSPDLVLTTFGVLNGARRARVITGDGRRLETADVVAWNRRADWAFLRVAGAHEKPLDRTPTRPSIGDRCYFLDLEGDGSRTIAEAAVTGLAGTGDLMITATTGGASSGAPVLNEYGEGVGTTGGAPAVAGATRVELAMLGPEVASASQGGRIRGFPSLPEEGSASRTLEDLDRAGEFVRPLAHTPHFVYGILGADVERRGAARIPMAVDQRFRFSRREKSCVVLATWTPARKQDATVAFQLFDEDNRAIGASDATKAKLRPGESFVQYWTIPLLKLVPGIYRVDVTLGPEPVWRTYFRVTE
jgi:hypothetical protein